MKSIVLSLEGVVFTKTPQSKWISHFTYDFKLQLLTIVGVNVATGKPIVYTYRCNESDFEDFSHEISKGQSVGRMFNHIIKKRCMVYK